MTNTVNTKPGGWYTVTGESSCRVTCRVGDGEAELANLPGGGQAAFQAPGFGVDVEADGGYAVVPSKAPSAMGLGGRGDGYIESNLNVGHGAAAAVAAVCTLTPGDLATGGKLEDSNGQSVELEAPHKYAEGSAEFRDATEAGTLSIGEWSKEWEAQPRRDADMILTPLESYDGEETPYKFSVTNEYKTCEFEWYAPAGSSVQDLKVAINDEDGTPHWSDGPPLVVASINDEGELVLTANVWGAQGNGIKVTPSDNTPFELSEEVEFTNGQDARTAVDVFNDIHNDENCPVYVTLDADEQGLGFTAKEYGVNDAISAEGDMFSNWSGMSGGHGDYTVAELVTAIAGEFDDITPTAGEAEGTITLTATTAGAAANSIVYTASGCFGGGTVKQGSTTRGKNAVAQTEYNVTLNGGAPLALDVDKPLRHGLTYAVVAGVLDLSGLEVQAHATAYLQIDVAADANITLGDWVWPEGDSPGGTDWTAGDRWMLTLRNDGLALLACVQYHYSPEVQA